MSEIPQFFGQPTVQPANPEATDRALYRLSNPDNQQEDFLIMVEGVEGTGNVPRNATSFTKIIDRVDLEKQLNAAAAMARLAIDAMLPLAPGEVQMEFGIELGGELGIPTVTKVEGKANFKITLTWKETDPA